MQITCPSCKRRYRLQDSLIRSPYQKMRCSRCGHVFVYGQDEGKVGAEVEQKPLLTPPGIVEKLGAEKSRKGIRALLLVVLVIIILAACGYYYWVNYLGAGNRWLGIRKMEGQETVIRDGRVFLIQGVVENDSTKPRRFVILKAKLFDDQRAAMGERFALAGLRLSKEEVEQLARPDIDAKIAAFRKSNVNAFVVPSKQELPFSIIFADPYTGKPKEFTVEIVEAPRME
jgi:predicted Zn finger-like uncharacterized protein